MNETSRISRTIADEVSSWPGVAVDDGELGEVSFKVGRREIGHVHGEHVAHFSFPRATWMALFEQRRIVAHPVFPDKRGPAERRIVTDADVVDVIALLRVNYDRVVGRRDSGPEAAGAAAAGG